MLRASLSIAALLAGGASVEASPIESRAAASIPQKVGNYAYKGCHSDLTNGGTRVLPLSLANPNNTVEGCISVAAKNGYSLAGVEYYGECWVGNKLDSSSKVQGDAACNLVCWGNSKQFCGGQGGSTGAAMQLYSLPSANSTVSPVNSTATATTTTTAAATATPTFVKSYTSGSQNWTRKGCQSDLRYGTRALSNRLASPKTRTVEGCLDACTSAGYSLCGVEWDGECWAANSLDSTSIALDDLACNKVCADNSIEICGGTGGESGAAFQLFSAATSAPVNTSTPTNTTSSAVPSATAATGLAQGGEVVKTVNSTAGPAWSNNGCYGDLKYGTRALSHLFAQETTGTVEACVNACQEAGYSLCGVEYQGECWGGDSIESTSSQVDASVCNLACSGDKTQRCGGSQAAGTPGIAPFGASFQLYAQCGENVATCTLDAASSCSGDFVLYDGACDATTCPDGWFNDSQVCKQCNSVDKTCTSLTNATACADGHVLYKNACNLTACPEATFNSNSTCLSCGLNAKVCSSSTAASKCFDNFYLNSTSACVGDCDTGFFGNASGACETCSIPNAISCSSATIAKSCITGYKVSSNGQCVRDCEDPYATTCSSPAVATACQDGYWPKNGQCTRCSNSWATKCDQTNGVTALACLPGLYLWPEAGLCVGGGCPNVPARGFPSTYADNTNGPQCLSCEKGAIHCSATDVGECTDYNGVQYAKLGNHCVPASSCPKGSKFLGYDKVLPAYPTYGCIV
ncbi:hypothetical protein JCM8097_005597 [Rhodosporidiobolus ruineniae]